MEPIHAKQVSEASAGDGSISHRLCQSCGRRPLSRDQELKCGCPFSEEQPSEESLKLLSMDINVARVLIDLETISSYSELTLTNNT